MPENNKCIISINQKNADGSFTRYPIGAKGRNIILESGSNLETTLKNIDIELKREYILIEVPTQKSNWIKSESDNTYTQIVNIEGIVEDRAAFLVNLMDKNATLEQQKKYSNDFGIISNGYIETGQGQVSFKVYSEPTDDITVGIVFSGGTIVEKTSLQNIINEDKDKVIKISQQKSNNTIDDEINVYKTLLSQTDYQAIKYSEGAMSKEEYEPIKIQRQSWRDKINELEAQLS